MKRPATSKHTWVGWDEDDEATVQQLESTLDHFARLIMSDDVFVDSCVESYERMEAELDKLLERKAMVERIRERAQKPRSRGA